MALDPTAFAGTDRFTVERCLGSGGFGTVYLTYDRLRHTPVALKLLRHADPASLLALKREFRALADLSHPNLVSLYELLNDGDQWFITMEHVKGNEFVGYVDGTVRAADADTADTADRVTGADAIIAPRPLRPALTPTNLERLSDALHQLATGLAYLHGEGKLHRDIKPSNVLVTDEGRVVLLDFGLVTDLESQAGGSVSDIRGTPAYMAPLREPGAPFTPADDWYSVGVMLFEVLTGTLPFTGTLFDVLHAKSSADAPSPKSLVSFVPDELDQLCRGLLSREPEQRVQAAASLLRDHKRSRPAPVAAPQSVWASTVPLVGRDSHLEALDKAFLESKDGHAVTAYVHGSSGMGKTALVRAFLRSLPGHHGPVVTLSGRCFERESVPYKALDSVVDALSDYLCSLPSAQVKSMLPRDILALARVFPVLRRVDAIVKAKHRVLEIPDALELRRRAFAAFRELMARLADHRSVVVFIDDLQWGDEDSAALLAELLRPPDAPPLLLIATYRSEEATSSAALRRLLPEEDAAASPSVWQIPVSGLTPEQSKELTTALQSRGAAAATLDDAVLREAAGNPFLISELARYAHPHDGGGTALTLDEVIYERVRELPPAPRRLLEILSVFGQPLDQFVANRAAAIDAGAMEAISLLRAQHLSRTRVNEQREELETYHDRIRETVVSHLSSEALRDHHRSLADTLVTLDNPDPEILAVHYEGAGEPIKAAGYSVLAADRAADLLAFDRAARLYRRALDLDPSLAPDRVCAIQIKLGDALASAGRGGQAAAAYLAAATLADPRRQLDLRRRAAEQQLRSGQIDDGFDTIRSVLAAIGMSLAKSPQRALLSMLWQRAKIRARGLKFVERKLQDISPDDLMKIDTCWSVAMGLGIVDNIRGADFQGRHLLLALDAGEPYRVARALSMEVAYAVVPGHKRARERSRRIAEMAQALAERVNHPQALGLLNLTRGTAASLQGEHRLALDLCEKAEQILDEQCTGVGWELAATHLYLLLSMFYLGQIGALSRRLPLILQEARERDDLNAVANLRTRLAYLVSLAADDVPAAKEEVQRGIAVWSRKGFTAQHFFELQALVDIAAYEDQGAAGWSAVERSWDALKGSLLLRVQRIHLESLWFRIRAAVAAAEHDESRRVELLQDADKTTKQLRRLDARHAVPLSTLADACIAATAGRRDEARRHLDTAIGLLEAADLPMHLVAAKRVLGEMQQDARVAESDRWLLDHGVKNPAKWTRMLLPGTFCVPGSQP